MSSYDFNKGVNVASVKSTTERVYLMFIPGFYLVILNHLWFLFTFEFESDAEKGGSVAIFLINDKTTGCK